MVDRNFFSDDVIVTVIEVDVDCWTLLQKSGDDARYRGNSVAPSQHRLSLLSSFHTTESYVFRAFHMFCKLHAAVWVVLYYQVYMIVNESCGFDVSELKCQYIIHQNCVFPELLWFVSSVFFGVIMSKFGRIWPGSTATSIYWLLFPGQPGKGDTSNINYSAL